MRKNITWLLSLWLVCQLQVTGASLVTTTDELTPKEMQAAIALADALMKQWEETGEMKPIVESLYAPDFIERFVEQEKKNPSAFEDSSIFMPGIDYHPALLEVASKEDWQKLYIAGYELTFLMWTHIMNQTAGAMLLGKEPESEQWEKSLERMVPFKFRKELADHPILKGFSNSEADTQPIKTVEEMRQVIVWLEKITTAIKQQHGKNAYQPTLAARKWSKKTQLGLLSDIMIEKLSEGGYGLSAGARVILMPTLMGHFLVIAEIQGQYKILWIIPMSV